jgi:hypothetical protein
MNISTYTNRTHDLFDFITNIPRCKKEHKYYKPHWILDGIWFVAAKTSISFEFQVLWEEKRKRNGKEERPEWERRWGKWTNFG